MEKTGLKYGCVYHYYKDEGHPEPSKTEGVAEGHNADRHLCRTCRFRSMTSKRNGCDYIEHAKKSRGCSVEDCSVYEEGEPERIKTE